MLRPKDSAFVIHFDREAELLQELTSSREKLQSALDKLKTPDEPTLARSGGKGGPGGGSGLLFGLLSEDHTAELKFELGNLYKSLDI